MTAAGLLAELRRRSLELRVDGDRLRYRPRSALTDELRRQVEALKPALMALLRCGTGSPARDPASSPGEAALRFELPPRPPDQPGHICELACRRGRWEWRLRRPDAADRAYEAWKREGRRPESPFDPTDMLDKPPPGVAQCQGRQGKEER